jgi:hypothetical protein
MSFPIIKFICWMRLINPIFGLNMCRRHSWLVAYDVDLSSVPKERLVGYAIFYQPNVPNGTNNIHRDSRITTNPKIG